MINEPQDPLEPYKGTEPYVFVSYSHKDTEAVYSEIRWLQQLNIKAWFDKGIEPGSEWSDTLATAISGCAMFVYYITPNSVNSEHCRREVSFANDKSLPVLGVYLHPTELPGGLQLSLGNRQLISKSQLSKSEYQNKLLDVLSVAVSAADREVSRSVNQKQISVIDQRKGILVLPFVNRSREEDSDYIGEGIADEIMAALSRIEVLRVISRNSATQIDHEELDLTSIGHQLNVQYLLRGSVQKSGSKLRITAQLPDTESGELLWADKWNSNLDQIFDIQETIARAVVDALNVQLNSSQEAQLSNRPIPNIHAYEYYLRARQLIYKYTPTALAQALDYLNRGQQLIGENAHITAAVGYVHWQYYNAGIELDPEHLKATHDCADRLFALDPESTDAHRLMGLVSMLEKGAIQTSVRHLKLALDGDANDTDALFWLALFYGFAGRISSGQALVERLLAIDPLTTLPQILPGFLDMMDGNLERGRVRLLKGHNLNEGNPITTLAYGQVLAMNANLEEAEEVFSLLNEFVPDSFLSQLGKFYIYAMHKDKDAALSVATKEFQQEASSDPHYAWGLAQCFSLIQAKAEAFEWLQIAIQSGFWNYPLLSEHDPLLAFVRSDERFAELMDDLKTKWIYFEV